MQDGRSKEKLVEGTPGGTSGTDYTETTGSGAGTGAAGPAEGIVGRSGADDPSGLVQGGHDAGDPVGRDGSSDVSSEAPQDESGLTGEGLGDEGDFGRETPDGPGTDAVGRGSPDAGDPGGMDGVRASADTHGRPRGGVSPMGSREDEEEER